MGFSLGKLAGIIGAGAGIATGNPALIAGGLGAFGSAQDAEKLAAANKKAAAQADPFAPYRSQFAQQLLQLYGVKPEFQFSKQDELDAAKGTGIVSEAALRNAYSRKTSAARNSILHTLSSNAGDPTKAAALQKEYDTEKAAYDAQPVGSTYDYLKNLPGYQAALEGGTEAIARKASAAGMSGSGNLLLDLQKYGSDLASQTFQSESDRLASLAGAGSVGGGAQYTANVPQSFLSSAAGGNLLAELSKQFAPTKTPGAAATPSYNGYV